ncbi:tRNA (adenosine(37)-N6)-threonylcarbamoyltransferase complex ATPase subunit type 1 TsaE [Patescibacteria group bacterium]
MITNSDKETIAQAKKFAKKLDGGDVVVLTGDLGGGKTTFVRGLAEGLGLQGPVTSPTFVIMQIYKGGANKPTLHHFDLYRIDDEEELRDVGFDDYMEDEESIVVVEWGEKFPAMIPKRAKNILFKNLGAEKREIVFT